MDLQDVTTHLRGFIKRHQQDFRKRLKTTVLVGCTACLSFSIAVSSAEHQVVEQTEEVFESYVFYRYQQEREQNEADVPVDPEITEMQERPDR